MAVLAGTVSLLETLTSAILPVLAIAGVGYLLGTYREIPVDPLATVTIYVLVPALVFHSIATTPIAGRTAITIVTGVGAFTLLMVLIGESLGRGIGETEPILGALVLVVTFPNAGNFGIPLAEFAFGAVGRDTAVLFIVGQSIMMYTLGVYVASRGEAGAAMEATKTVFKVPLVYAVVAGVLARWLDLVPAADSAAMRTIQLTGDAAIPVMLLLLGLQLSTQRHGAAIARVLPAVSTKLLVAPIVGLGIALGLGLDGTVAKVFVLACSMPAAITPLMLTIEFGAKREGLDAAGYVSTAIFISTVASILTLTALIWILNLGLVI